MVQLLIASLVARAAGLNARIRDEDGAVTIEYGVITVFIALGMIAAALVLVPGVTEWFGNIVTYIKALPGDPSAPAG